MLLLTRKINVVVLIGDDIKVEVLAVNGIKVLLGFKAPTKITVHREEIYHRIQKQKMLNNKLYVPQSNVIKY